MNKKHAPEMVSDTWKLVIKDYFSATKHIPNLKLFEYILDFLYPSDF